MYRPHREQAQLLQGISVGHRMGQHPKSTVGAKLARDGCLTFNKDAGCTGLIASRLTPTRDLCRAQNWAIPKINCRSEPARDGCLTFNKDAGCTGLIASRLTPTRDPCRARNWVTPQNPLWEQSLLAMAAQHSTNLLNVPPSSRASSAPTGINVGHEIGQHPKSTVGAKLARDGCSTFNKSAECTAVIASKLGSHRGSVSGTEWGNTQNPLWE